MAKKKPVPLPPESEVRAAVLSALRLTTEPVSAKQLVALLKAALPLDEAALSPILNGAVTRDELHPFPPARAKGKPRYWDRDQAHFGRELIVALLDKKGPLSKADVKKGVKGLDAVTFEQAFQTLLENRRLSEHPPIGRTKTVKFGSRPPAPELYLKDVEALLKKVVGQLSAVGVEPEALRRAVWDVLAHAGVAASNEPAFEPARSVRADSERAASPEPIVARVTTLNILLLMRQIEPGAERGAMVSARDLRRVANLDKPEFDLAVLDLARQGRLMLHRHDHASHLAAHERDELVTDGAGNYYVGLALRRTEA